MTAAVPPSLKLLQPLPSSATGNRSANSWSCSVPGKLGTKAKCPLDVIDRLIVSADLMSDQTEQVEGSDTVERLGLLEIACLVIPQGLIEHLRDRMHG